MIISESSEYIYIILLFQASLHQQSFPNIWKHANVNPIYKKGDKTCPSNYRPASVLDLYFMYSLNILFVAALCNISLGTISYTHCNMVFVNYCIKLQEDLNNLERWIFGWQMYFHPEKCEVIHITTKKNPIIHKYTLHGHTASAEPKLKSLEYTSLKTLSGILFISTPSPQRRIRH